MQRKPTRKWWSVYDALHAQGEIPQLELPLGKGAKDKKVSTVPTEQDEHFIAAAFLRKNNIPHHHSPNGGWRDAREAAKFKRMGTSPGFPDFWIPLARKGHHGLYIELKRVSGGTLSDHQKYWRDLSLREGYAWYEAKGAMEFITIVKSYLGAQG